MLQWPVRDLAVLKCELVANLSRASGKATADSRGCDGPLSHFCEISYICDRSVFGNCSVNPRLAGGTPVLVGLITDERVTREELVEVIGLAGVVCMEERGDDWW